MNADWRLDRLDPHQERRSSQRAEAEREVRARIPSAQLAAAAGSLADVALASVSGGAVPPPESRPEYDAGLSSAWACLYAMLTSDTGTANGTAEERVLGREVVSRLAERVASRPELWLAAFQRAERLDEGWSMFPESMDPGALRAHAEVLSKIGPVDDPAEWIEPFGRIRNSDAWKSSVERARALEREEDLWAALDQTSRLADELQLSSDLHRRSVLAKRAGMDIWARWLGELPVALLAQGAMRNLRSPDEALALLESALSSIGAEAPRARIVALTVRRSLEVFEELWLNLAHGADARWAMPEEAPEYRARCQTSLQEWKDRELNERATVVAETLLRAGTLGRSIAVLALRHLFENTGSEYSREARVNTTGAFRLAVIKAFVHRKQVGVSLLDEILTATPSRGGVLAGSRLLLESANEEPTEFARCVSLVIDGYTTWLGCDGWWAGSLLDDDFQLAWCVGGVVGLTENPCHVVHSLLRRLEVPAEGWKYDAQRYFESRPKVAHTIVVGAMASEWLVRANHERAVVVFQEVWDFAARWLRGAATTGPSDDQMRNAVMQLWARAPVMFGEAVSEMALAVLDSLENLEWLVLAAVHLKRNLKAPGTALSVALQNAIQKRFCEQMPALRHRHGSRPETLEQLAKFHAEVTPDLEPVEAC